MNRKLVVCLFALTLGFSFTPLVGKQPAAAAASIPFAGAWRGTTNDLPGIDLTIRQVGEKVSGSVVFYFQEHADVNSPWHATAGSPLPLLKLHVDARVLTFEVEHYVCHGCRELGPNVVFRMELVGANKARLTRLEEDGSEGAQMKLVRGNAAMIQTAPPLRQGISVDMPVAENATPMPDADKDDALIVTVNGDGNVYMGTNRLDPDALGAELQRLALQKAAQKLYLKADTHTPYASVIKVLDAAIAAGIRTTVFLTSQNDLPQPGMIVPPKGLVLGNEGCLAALRPRLSL